MLLDPWETNITIHLSATEQGFILSLMERVWILSQLMFVGKESLWTRKGWGKYLLTMEDIFPRFWVAAAMPDHTVQTVKDTVRAGWILLV